MVGVIVSQMHFPKQSWQSLILISGQFSEEVHVWGSELIVIGVILGLLFFRLVLYTLYGIRGWKDLDHTWWVISPLLLFVMLGRVREHRFWVTSLPVVVNVGTKTKFEFDLGNVRGPWISPFEEMHEFCRIPFVVKVNQSIVCIALTTRQPLGNKLMFPILLFLDLLHYYVPVSIYTSVHLSQPSFILLP